MSILVLKLIWLYQRLWVTYEDLVSRFLISLKNKSRHRLNEMSWKRSCNPSIIDIAILGAIM
jgi:hypothetical protein